MAHDDALCNMYSIHFSRGLLLLRETEMNVVSILSTIIYVTLFHLAEATISCCTMRVYAHPTCIFEYAYSIECD